MLRLGRGCNLHKVTLQVTWARFSPRLLWPSASVLPTTPSCPRSISSVTQACSPQEDCASQTDCSPLRAAHRRWPEIHVRTLLYQISMMWSQVLQAHQARWPCNTEVKRGKSSQIRKAQGRPPKRSEAAITALSPTHPAACGGWKQ